MVSGVSVFDYKWGKILRKMVVVCLIFGRMLRLCFLFLYILLFNIFIVGIYVIINDMPMILCLISVIWNVCLNGLFRILFCSIVLVGTRNTWIFPDFTNVDPCAVANLLDVSRGVKFGCSNLISFHVGIIIIFDSAPESIKKSISRSGG